MSKMIGSSVLWGWTEATSSAEDCDLYIMIESLKESILDVVTVQARIGRGESCDMLQDVNANMVTLCRQLTDLFEEVKGQIYVKGGDE